MIPAVNTSKALNLTFCAVFSVQAIAIATRVAHNLGHSDSIANLLISAYGIARSLGLHRIKSPVSTLDLEHPSQASASRSAWFELIEVEVGKRTWWQIVVQDHFSISFMEAYSTHPQQPLVLASTTDTLKSSTHPSSRLHFQ